MTRTDSTTPIWGKIAIVALILMVVCGYLFEILIAPFGGLDFSIYRMGAMTIFDNEGFTKDLYAPVFIEIGVLKLPFTYPPFAALVFLPFAFLPLEVGKAIMVLGTTAAAWWLSATIYNYAQTSGRALPLQGRLGRTGTIATLTIVVMLCGPWRRTFHLMQINPLIMALILADFVRPATRVPRGVLVGIAGGLKLTPLVFGLILLVRRDWKGIAALGATFLATIVVGFILLPNEAPQFWFSAISDSSRVGDINFVDNISIQGWLMHFGLKGTALKLGFYALAALSIALVAVLLYQLERRGKTLAQVAVAGTLMVALSPISWSHHNVLLPLLLAALILDAFPTFMVYLPSAARKIACVLAWVAGVGLYISPRIIGGTTQLDMNGLEFLWAPGVAIGGFPSFALWATVMFWAVASLSAPVRGAKVEPVQYGSVRSDAPLGWWGARALVAESAQSARAAASREATA